MFKKRLANYTEIFPIDSKVSFFGFHSFDNCRNLASSNANKAPTCEVLCQGGHTKKPEGHGISCTVRII